jgi:hypothetical protein
MSDSTDSIVGQIKGRVNGLRIPIDKFIQKITFVYERPAPIGFDFDCSNTKELIAHLSLNLNFGLDNQSEVAGHTATRLARGLSFREVSSHGSIHFEISKLDVNVHLDTISVVAGRDEHGNIIYNTGNLLQHLASDHLNWKRVIAPNSDDGFVWGFRF